MTAWHWTSTYSPLCSREGDYLYVGPTVFDQLEDAQEERELPEYLANSRFHKVGCLSVWLVAREEPMEGGLRVGRDPCLPR